MKRAKHIQCMSQRETANHEKRRSCMKSKVDRCMYVRTNYVVAPLLQLFIPLLRSNFWFFAFFSLFSCKLWFALNKNKTGQCTHFGRYSDSLVIFLSRLSVYLCFSGICFVYVPYFFILPILCSLFPYSFAPRMLPFASILVPFFSCSTFNFACSLCHVLVRCFFSLSLLIFEINFDG